jgi:hypothetical protein
LILRFEKFQASRFKKKRILQASNRYFSSAQKKGISVLWKYRSETEVALISKKYVGVDS